MLTAVEWRPRITQPIGSCDRDYGCIYMNTLSWRTPTTPLPMEINPRKVFERMFGQGGSVAERKARIQEDRSILDAITRDASALQLRLGPSDRQAMGQYLENIREIERRIQLAEKSQGDEALVLPARPAGVPFDFEEHVRLIAPCGGAYQKNSAASHLHGLAAVSTRSTAGGFQRGASRDVHHEPPDKMEKLLIQFHVGISANSRREEHARRRGSLLDNTVLLRQQQSTSTRTITSRPQSRSGRAAAGEG